jgi:glycosyltransferase involved in cell wall biosynthesis
MQLDALVRQDWIDPLEIVVADNGSTDSTRDIALSYVGRLPLKVVDASETRGRAHALNIGIANTSGEMILFLDGDDIVDQAYVSTMVAVLERHPVVAGRLEVCELNDWRRNTDPDGTQSAGISGGMMGWLPFAFGASLGIRRSVIAEVGPFDGTVPRNEDVEFCYRLQLHGHSITFVPIAVVHYRLRSSAKAVFRQSRESGRGVVRLYTLYRLAGMPRRGPKSVARFWLGGIRQCCRTRTRADLLLAARIVGLRLGLLEGSIRYRAVYL